MIETESRLMVARVLGEEGMGSDCNGYRVSIWNDENVQELDGGDDD